jgi:hypothetical protein
LMATPIDELGSLGLRKDRLIVGCYSVIVPKSCRHKNRVGPVPALRAETAAQARPVHRAGPGTGTMAIGLGRARAVLFRAVLGPAHRAWAKWPSISIVVF